MKTKILADFQICISVTLSSKSPYSVPIRENTDLKKTLYSDIFDAAFFAPQISPTLV